MNRVALLGGPASGKSTYLGALLDGLQMETIEHLRMGPLPADATALSRLPEALQQGRYPDRTSRESRTPVVVPLRTEGALLPPMRFDLRTGDFAGETVDALFKDRQWSEEWTAWAESDAILLFLRPDASVPLPQPAVSLDDQARWRHLRGEVQPEPPRRRSGLRAALGPAFLDEAPPPPPRGPLDPVCVPTSLAMVELLQLLRHSRGYAPGERPLRGSLRIVLVVSAWDAVSASWRERGPNALLASDYALLEDFVACNFWADDVLRVGLSATRGDLKTAEGRAQYLQDPGGEVVWRRPDGQVARTTNLGLPVLWALFGDRALADL